MEVGELGGMQRVEEGAQGLCVGCFLPAEPLAGERGVSNQRCQVPSPARPPRRATRRDVLQASSEPERSAHLVCLLLLFTSREVVQT